MEGSLLKKETKTLVKEIAKFSVFEHGSVSMFEDISDNSSTSWVYGYLMSRGSLSEGEKREGNLFEVPRGPESRLTFLKMVVEVTDLYIAAIKKLRVGDKDEDAPVKPPKKIPKAKSQGKVRKKKEIA